MRKIAIDVMGEEYVPEAIVEAVLEAKAKLSNTKFLLSGDENKIKKLLADNSINKQTEVIATTEIIQDEDEPARAIRRKKDSSLVAAARYVKEGKVDGLVSLGSTSALLAAGIFVVGRTKGIEHPGLMPTLPVKSSDLDFSMIDVGANAQAKPEHIPKWTGMANFYAEKVRGIKNPRIALLNNGAKYDEGDNTHKEAYQLLKESKLSSIGNIEGSELLDGKADIVAIDGFTGNAVLKNIEGTSSVTIHLIKESLLNGSLTTKLGASLIKSALKGIAKKLDIVKYGGAVLLGSNASVVKTYGRSDKRTIYYILLQVDKMIEEELTKLFVNDFSKQD